MRTLRKYSYYLFSIFELLVGFNNPLLIVQIFLGASFPSPRLIRLRRTGLRFFVRGKMDIWSIKEIFLDRFYERYGFQVGSAWTVIDIGAGIGDYTVFASKVEGTRIFALEPAPASFELLIKNLSLNRQQNVQVFMEAMGGASGESTLDLRGGEPLQFRTQAGSPSHPGLQVSVPTRSLSDLFCQLGLEYCDLVKLDCEGAEYEILFNTPSESLQRIRRIVMEYHDQITAYSHNDLVRFLQAQGFTVDRFANPVHADLGYLRAER